jgi:hypothetical protein
MITLWDLDGTVIDTSHRYTALPDGGIDLPAWIRDNTPENVAKDSLLPLAERMRKAWSDGHQVYIVTARVMNWWDWKFLSDHELHFHECFHRPEGLALNDADYKEFHVRNLAAGLGLSWRQFTNRSFFWEDARCVIERMESINVNMIDAKRANARRMAL